MILAATHTCEVNIDAGDVFVVAQKIISKSEGRLVCLKDVEPSPFARNLASSSQRDPRFIEVVLRESRRIVRISERVIITETHHGLVCANAGVDRSNVAGEDVVSLLPAEPNLSAQGLRAEFRQLLDKDVAVIITDTFGRPWREGLTNVAIGLAGINPLNDLRNQKDGHGKLLQVTVLATADELASAAGLIMRKSTGVPVVLVKGCEYDVGEHSASELLRAKENDLFR